MCIVVVVVIVVSIVVVAPSHSPRIDIIRILFLDLYNNSTKADDNLKRFGISDITTFNTRITPI